MLTTVVEENEEWYKEGNGSSLGRGLISPEIRGQLVLRHEELRTLLENILRYLEEFQLLRNEVNALKARHELIEQILNEKFNLTLGDFQKYFERLRVIEELRDELASKYRGKVVAITYDKKILIAEEDEITLLKKLITSNIDPDNVFIYRVETD